MMNNRYFAVCVTALLVLSLASAAHAELFLLLNIGDGEDRQGGKAGKTFQKARNGNQPTVIDSDADRYFVHLPGASMNTLDGSAKRVGEDPAANRNATTMTQTGAITMAETGDGAQYANESEGDTGWVEFEASAASLMLFSPDGLDQESSVRYEPARVFLGRFGGEVYVMITGENGAPPADTND